MKFPAWKFFLYHLATLEREKRRVGYVRVIVPMHVKILDPSLRWGGEGR
jgi:hypothetical protein